MKSTEEFIGCGETGLVLNAATGSFVTTRLNGSDVLLQPSEEVTVTV